MPIIVMVVLMIGLLILVAAGFCVITANHLDAVFRLLAAVPFLGTAAFSVYGFLASREPGGGAGWAISYGVAFALSLVALSRLAFAGNKERS